jgi:hypothetical protein
VNILTVNKVNSSNFGDRAIGESLQKILLEQGYEVTTCDLTGAPRGG